MAWRHRVFRAIPEASAMQAPIPICAGRIAAFCRKHHIRRLARSGPVPRDDFTAARDGGVLATCDAEQMPGLACFDLEGALSEIPGRTVNLNTA